jgi:hypothetical protein
MSINDVAFTLIDITFTQMGEPPTVKVREKNLRYTGGAQFLKVSEGPVQVELTNCPLLKTGIVDRKNTTRTRPCAYNDGLAAAARRGFRSTWNASRSPHRLDKLDHV